MSRVLVVEDEKDIADLMVLHLKREGFEADLAEDGEHALRMLESKQYGLVVLDWMLPGTSGLDICKKMRGEPERFRSTPILMVTARAQSSDIVVGLEMGADDYLTKPFEVSVFVARVRALFRRAQVKAETDTDRLQVGELSLDPLKHEVVCGKEEVKLTPSEFKLLHALMRNRGRVLTRERLIDLVQGEGVTVIDRAIDTHIFGLRKKIGECGNLVETIRGVGYRINTTVG